MAFNEPVPTYAEVSFTFTDKFGKTKNQFNPAWLSYFLSLASSVGNVSLDSGAVSGVLPTAKGGTGTDISAYFTGDIAIAKLTGGGADGTISVIDGFITSVVPAT